MLKNDIGVHEVERAVGKHAEGGIRRDVRVGMRDIFQLFASQSNHFVGNIDAMDFAEVPAHGPHQPPWTASDLERAGRGSDSDSVPRHLRIHHGALRLVHPAIVLLAQPKMADPAQVEGLAYVFERDRKTLLIVDQTIEWLGATLLLSDNPDDRADGRKLKKQLLLPHEWNLLK